MDDLIHVPEATQQSDDVVLRDMATRIMHLEHEKSEYQLIAGRASQECAWARETVARIEHRADQLQIENLQLHQEVGSLEEDLQKMESCLRIGTSGQQDKPPKDPSTLHEFMSRKSICPVCLEEKRQCVVMPCLHCFCQRCVMEWGRTLPTDKPVTCPICRECVIFTRDFETNITYQMNQ